MHARATRCLVACLLIALVATVALPPSPGLAAGSTVSGVVLVDDDGSGGAKGRRPLGGASVRIAGPGLTTSVATAPNGGFQFGGLSPGAYTISVLVPPTLIPINGTARTVQVDGKGSYQADFLFALKAPTPTPVPPTPTPVPPTPTPLPTLPPVAIVTPIPTPAPDAEEPGGPTGGSRGQSQTGRQAAPVPQRPLVTSLQGLRYAPGRTSPSQPQTVRNSGLLWLGVPFVTQLDGTPYASVNCGPASTTMVLAAFGMRIPAATIRDYVNYLSGVYSSDAGTSLDHLARVSREAGLQVADLYGGGRYRAWSAVLLREHILVGHPVVTLVKYRALPGNGASLADLDHYIVISGLSGNDFIYNDAAFTSDRGYGLLISEGDLQRAWDYSSIPRHGMAVFLPEPEPAQAVSGGDDVALALQAAGLGLGEELDEPLNLGDLVFQRVLVDPDPNGEPSAESGDGDADTPARSDAGPSKGDPPPTASENSLAFGPSVEEALAETAAATAVDEPGEPAGAQAADVSAREAASGEGQSQGPVPPLLLALAAVSLAGLTGRGLWARARERPAPPTAALATGDRTDGSDAPC